MKLGDLLPVVPTTEAPAPPETSVEGAPPPEAGRDLPPPPGGDKSAKQGAGQDGEREGTPLEGVAKWVATGFVLISSLLTFLGLTSDDKLDRILGAYPGSGLLVFVLVGLAVVLAIIAPALPRKPQLGFGLIPAVLVVLSGVVYFTVPDLGEMSLWEQRKDFRWVFVTVLAILLLGVILGTWKRLPVPMNAMALAIAVISLSLGGYAAMKVAVLSKAPTGLGTISTELKTDSSRATLDVTVSLAAIDPENFVELRTSFLDDTTSTENPVPRKLASDATGLVTDTMQFLLPAPIPEFVTLSLYNCDAEDVNSTDADQGEEETAKGDDCVDMGLSTTVRLVADRNARLDLALVQHDDGIHLDLAGAGFGSGTPVMLCVQTTDVTTLDEGDQASKNPTQVLRLRTSAASDGSVQVEEILPNLPPLTLVEARASASSESCTDGEPATSATWTTYEKYVADTTDTTEPPVVEEPDTTDPS